MAIDPNVQAMANRMTSARGGRQMGIQGAPPQQQPAQEGGQGAVIDQLRALLTKALELLGPGGQ